MTRRPPLPLLVLALLAPVFALLSAAAASPAEACGPGGEGVERDGLVVCTHGNEEPPAGVDTTELPSTAELLEARFGVDEAAEVQEVVEDGAAEPAVAAAGTVACIGDGVSGPRVQVVYARASNVASRYTSVLPLLRQYAADIDDIINVSAGRVGDGRRVRFVTNDNCVPEVTNVTVSSTGDDTFYGMVNELRAQGMTNVDRKYLIFADAAVGICGLGEVYMNDRGDQLNPNNDGRPQYARVDTSCWQYAAAHELIHTMGGVQNSAPNTSGAGHCTDEVDVMCYKDTSTTVTRQVCDRAGQVDCNNNDYFHPNPRSSSYLDTKWNVARSRFLAGAEPPPPPPATNVSVATTGYAGAPWAVRANVATSGAGIVWSSTRNECWFDDPRAASTSWTCPATSQGGAEITVQVTENSVTTPYSTAVSLTVPATKLATATSLRSSETSIRAGQTATLMGKVIAIGTGAPVAGLPVEFQVRPKHSKVWSAVGSDVTNRNGGAQLDVAPLRNASYRMRTNYNHTWDMTFSAAVDIAVSTKVTTKINSTLVAPYSTTSVQPYATSRITGEVSPNKSGDIIKLKRYTKGRWRVVREKRLSDRSRYTFRYTPKTSGKHYLRVVKPRDSRNLRTRKTITLRAG